jgi:acetylornithine deacetylase/succinyl-diaminopimelate desuccinylase-like protein
MKAIDAIVQPMSPIRPGYYGIFEENDPSRRLIVVAHYDNGVPEYGEWSGQALFPFHASNEAYKRGVNDMMYGLTH